MANMSQNKRSDHATRMRTIVNTEALRADIESAKVARLSAIPMIRPLTNLAEHCFARSKLYLAFHALHVVTRVATMLQREPIGRGSVTSNPLSTHGERVTQRWRTVQHPHCKISSDESQGAFNDDHIGCVTIEAIDSSNNVGTTLCTAPCALTLQV